MVLLELGWNARTNRGDEAPLAHFATSLLMRRDAGDSQRAVECVESIAVLAADRGRYAESAFMFGAADAWRRDRGAPLIPPLLDELRDAQQEAQRAIGGERFAAAWSSGAVAPLERAIQAALDLDLDLE